MIGDDQVFTCEKRAEEMREFCREEALINQVLNAQNVQSGILH